MSSVSNTVTYEQRRGQLETYFDRTAVEAWKRLTSDAPVGRIRATVRAGRDEMRSTLLSWLPSDMSGLKLLDAGCGTGALAVEAAGRGAHVVAVDLSPTLINLARERAPHIAAPGRLDFDVGDMLDAALTDFDYIVAMDSLIHYRAHDIVRVLGRLAERTRVAMLLTFAPKTAALATMHALGRLFPRGDRAPAIEPVAERALRSQITGASALAGWRAGRSVRVARSFYISHALELRSGAAAG